jgi:ATP-dependent DNA helicase RecQ
VDPVATLRTHFGYPSFRPGQEALVRAVLSGRDALGILPTGGGKSVCYQVPALLLPGLTLCVSPLVSLMADQVERARRAGIPAERLTADRTRTEREEVLAFARAGRLKLLLVSPERLAVPRFRALLGALRVSLLAIDEAHCISEWGHDFRPEYLELGSVRPLLRCPTLALPATATPAVRA